MAEGGQLMGGYSAPRPPTDEEMAMIMGLQAEAGEKANIETFMIFEPLLLTTQVVAGLNYKVKVKIADVSPALCIRACLGFQPAPLAGSMRALLLLLLLLLRGARSNPAPADLQIYQPLPHTNEPPTVQGFEMGKMEED